MGKMPLDNAIALLEKYSFFRVLKQKLSNSKTRYSFFIVDHGRNSKSTHRFWWNHFEDACVALGISVFRVAKDFSGDRRLNSSSGGATRVFLYFEHSSFSDGVRKHLTDSDIILSFDPRSADFFRQQKNLLFGFRSDKWLSRMEPLVQKDNVVFWDPFVPIHLIPEALSLSESGDIAHPYDFSFFGTISVSNYDEFEKILVPLARGHKCFYRGLSWRRWRIPYFRPLFYGFGPTLVDDGNAVSILRKGKINIVLHQTHHRVFDTVTERLFYSALVGRKIICDNIGARRYFDESECEIVDEEAPVTDDGARLFVDRCEEALKNFYHHEERSRNLQRKVLENYTYINTVMNIIDQLEQKMR